MKSNCNKIYKVRFFKLLICLLLFGDLQGQVLSVHEMHQDISFFKSSVETYFSFAKLHENRTGINVIKEIDKLKSEITDSCSIEKFTSIIKRGFNILYDRHSAIATKDQVKWYTTANHYLAGIGNAEISDTIYADRSRRIMNEAYSKLKCWLKTKYIGGKYYNVRPFSYKGVTIETGEEITAINGIPVNQFIQENYNYMDYLYWDPYKQQWYDEVFIYGLLRKGVMKFSLTINNKEIELDCAEPLENLKIEHKQSRMPKVFVINENILYVYMPQIMNEELYIEEIRKHYTSDINKIVFDIRDNGGGDDSVWQNILSKIISKPLTYLYKVGFNYDEELKSAINHFGNTECGNDNICIISSERTIEPDEHSLNFDGKFYVFQNKNTFSAAAALSTLAWQADNFTLVGERSAFIAGYTFPAIMLKLPNSKIVYKLAFSYDASGREENPYMDKVENDIVANNAEQYINDLFNQDLLDYEYLTTKDKLIKYVIQY